MKTYTAKITSITPNKVEVTGNLLEKPEKSSYIDSSKPFDFWKDSYKRAIHRYEASKFTAEVEIAGIENCEKTPNVIQLQGIFLWNPTNYLQHIVELKLGMSCQVTEPVNGKCKIIKIE